MKNSNTTNKLVGIASILALIAILLATFRWSNSNTASYVLDNVSNKKSNEYITEVSSWDKSYSSGIVEHCAVFKCLMRDKTHAKYVMVLSDNSRSTKTAFVITNPDQPVVESGRVRRSVPLFYPSVRE